MSTRNLIWLTIFSIAMGFMEAAVVIDLKHIYYPEGFKFPLVPIDGKLAVVEMWREAATMIMLLSVGILSAKNAPARLGAFIFSFAIWDIFYYVFLKVFDNWPESLFTWDLLFLLPFPWVGPVLTPVIASLTMILLALVLFRFNRGEKAEHKMNGREWSILVLGAAVMLASFLHNYLAVMLPKFDLSELLFVSDNQEVIEATNLYVPTEFIWWLFWLGECIILAGIGLFVWRGRNLLS